MSLRFLQRPPGRSVRHSLFYGALSLYANESLSDSDYQLFFQYSFDHFFISDNKGIILRVNNQWQKTLGYQQNDMEGKPFLSFVHPDDIKATTEVFLEILGSKSEEGFTNRYRTITGDYRYMEWKANLISDKVYATARDVTQRKMLENEREFSKQLFDVATDLLVTLSPEGVIRRVNPAVLSVLGYTEEEFLNKHFTAYFLPEDAEENIQIFERAKQTGAVYNHQTRNIKKDGTLANLHWHLLYLEKLETVFAAGRDIAEQLRTQRALAESEKRFRSLFQNMDLGFSLVEIVYDEQGTAVDFRFLEVNSANTKLTGYSADNVIGRTILEIDPSYNRSIIDWCATVAQTGIPQSTEVYYPPTDKHYYVQAYSPQTGQTAMIFSDISERIRTKNLIIEKNSQLETLIAEKDKFFSIIAHDLRSPFQGILGVLDILNDETESLTFEEIRRRLSGLRTTGKKLLGLIDNLLLWASFHRGSIRCNPEIVSAAESVSHAADSVTTAAHLKNLTLLQDVPASLYVSADSMMLNTILRNLLSNAIKFSYRGGKISVSCSAKEKMAEFVVKDEGTGIPDEDIPRLFMISEKVSTPGTENEPSSGLGLILCHEFAQANGGSIAVESTFGKGSAFILRIPLSGESS